jgi:hypothetical protein
MIFDAKSGATMKKAIASGFLSLFFSVASSFAETGERFSLSGEALVWWIKDSPAPPPLVSTGLIGAPGTAVILGGKERGTGEQPGFRLTTAYRPDERRGIEASFFYLSPQSAARSAGSSGESGSQNLFIPFFDVTIPGENVTNLSDEERFSGQAVEKLSARFLGAELNGVMTVASSAAGRVELLGGFRHLNLSEAFSFRTNSPDLAEGRVNIFETKDEFDTKNRFYGGQAGVRARHGIGRWSLEGSAKLALGAMVQSVEIDGFLLTNEFNGGGEPESFPGGYFAQPTNMGRRSRTVFAAVPEVKLNLAYDLTRRLTIFLGYTFLYAHNMVRPGTQIDRGINPTQNASFTGTMPSLLVGPARPKFSFRSSSFWAQGVNLGLTYRF